MSSRMCVQVCLVLLFAGAAAWCQTPKPSKPPRELIGTPRLAPPALIDDLPQEYKDRAKRISAEELPVTLDAMLAKAMRSNPDLRLAEIEVQKAEAELNQTRVKIAHEITSCYRQREALLELARTYQAIVEDGAATVQQNERYKLLETRQAIAKIESDLRYLVGVGTDSKPDSTAPPRGATTVSPHQAKILAQLRDKLEKTVDVQFNDHTLAMVAQYFRDKTDIAFVVSQRLQHQVVQFKLSGVSLRTAMSSIADVTGLRFVLRDYGILITTTSEAATMNAVDVLDGNARPTPAQ